MWEYIEADFSRFPSQAMVARYLLDTGIRVEDERLYVDKVSISHSRVAEALGKDKRVVTATIRTINANPRLYTIYSKLRPTCNLIDVAEEMGWGVIEITLSDPAKTGVLGNVATAIGEAGISIRQAIGEDPTYSSGLLFIVTEAPLTGYALEKLRGIPGVEKIILH